MSLRPLDEQQPKLSYYKMAEGGLVNNTVLEGLKCPHSAIPICNPAISGSQAKKLYARSYSASLSFRSSKIDQQGDEPVENLMLIGPS